MININVIWLCTKSNHLLSKKLATEGRCFFIQVKNGRGRPKAGVWTMSHIPECKEIRYQLDVPLLILREANKQLDQCICVYCENILVGPLFFRACEHSSCKSCSLIKIFKNPVASTVWPCYWIRPDGSHNVAVIKIKCELGCLVLI